MNTAIQNLLDTFHTETDYIRKAHILESLRRDHGLQVKEIATQIQKHSSYVSHLLRLTHLPEMIIDGYYSSQLSFAHLVVISRLGSQELMTQAYEIILKENLSSSETDKLVRKLKFNISSDTARTAPDELARIAKRIQDHVPGSTVGIVQTQIGATIQIKLSGNPQQTSKAILWMAGKLSKSEKEVSPSPEELIILE